jgi:hypothetical protein
VHALLLLDCFFVFLDKISYLAHAVLELFPLLSAF